MGSYYKQQLNEWVNTLEVFSNIVLDIGGSQSPLKNRISDYGYEDWKIVDLQTPHSDSPPPDIIQDMNEVLTGVITKYIKRTDAVFMLGVMDYVINPNIAMNNIHNLLSPAGYAWVEFPFVYPIHNPIDDEGCRYSEGCIRRLAKQANLQIKEIIYKRPKPNNRFLEMFYAEDGMRAAKGVDHNVTGYIVRFSK